MDVQEFLQERGLKPRDVENVFKEFDPDGSGTLDWEEFYGAMQVLNSKVPFSQAKRLFGFFDGDGNGRVDQAEFCSLIFPGMSFGQDGPPEFDASEARTTTGGGRVSMGDSPTGGRLSPNRRSPNRRRGGGGEGSPGGISSNLLAEARKKAEDARENKEPPIGEQLKDLKQRITDTQKIVEELVAGMKLLHRHHQLGPFSSNPQARPESPA